MAPRGLRRWRWAVVASVWVTIAIGVVSAITAVSLPGIVQRHLIWSWPVLLGLGVLATYLTIREDAIDGWAQLDRAPSALPTGRDRTRAIASIRKSVTDRLTEGLGGQPLLDLTTVPVTGLLPSADQPNFQQASATSSTTLLEAYESAGSMVLLGAAGAGKSTLLLRLAEDLLNQAEQSPDEPIPVVISLAGWGRRKPAALRLDWVPRLRRLGRLARRRPDLERIPDPPTEDLIRWLTRQVDDRYQVRPGDTIAWLRNRRLVLLLDSLDECAEEARDRFVAEFGRLAEPRVVLCCRTPDFEKLVDRPAFRVARSVQPLTRWQVERALAADLANALHEDAGLWQLLSAPIWLRIIRQLNHWPERVRDQSISVAERSGELLDAFLMQVFYKRPPKGTSTEQMLRWVTQLARLAGSADDPDSVDLRAPTRGTRASSPPLFPVVIRAIPALLIIPFALGFVLPLARLYGLASAGLTIAHVFAYAGTPVTAFLASGLAGGYDRAGIPTRRRRRWLAGGVLLTGAALGILGLGLVLGFHALAVTSMNTVRWILVAGFAVPAALLLLVSKSVRLRVIATGLAGLSIASVFVSTMAPGNFSFGVAGAVEGVLLPLPLLAVAAADDFNPEGFRLTPAMLVVMPVTVGLSLTVCLVPWSAVWLGHGQSVVRSPLVVATERGWLLAASCLVALVLLLHEKASAWTRRLILALEDRLPWRLQPLLDRAESSGLLIKAGAGYRFAHPLMRQHLAEMDILDLRPLTETDPELRERALSLVGQVIRQRRALAEPPARFPALLSSGGPVSELAQKLASPEALGDLEVIDGVPGSGRSLLLLDLASELISQPDAPVPLILPASVWGGPAIRADRTQPGRAEDLGQRTFTRLLLRAVNEEYGLTPQSTQQLLFQGKVVLFLDDGRLSRLEALRFLHLLASFQQAYPKVSLVLATDLAVLPRVVRDSAFGPPLLDGASTTRIMPLDLDILTSPAYAEYLRPLAELGFPAEDTASNVTTLGQLHQIVAAAQAELGSLEPLEAAYVTSALALQPGERWLRRAMGKIAWLHRPDDRPAMPPTFGLRAPLWAIPTPLPLAPAVARCLAPVARGLVLAIGGAYAIAPQLGTPTALVVSVILILLDVAWLGRPGRLGVGGHIPLRLRGAALVLGTALGLALGWAALELRGPLVHWVEGWSPLHRSLVFPLSAGVVVATAGISLALLRPGRDRTWLWAAGVAGLGAAVALRFAGPRPPEDFFPGFAAGVAVGASTSLLLALKVLFTTRITGAYQRLRPLRVRIVITLAWFGALCVAGSWGHPGGLHLWPAAGLVLGYCCSARLLFFATIGPAWLIYGPAIWLLAVLSGLLPGRPGRALREAQARGWILPDRTFSDPLLRTFLAEEAERAWSPDLRAERATVMVERR